MKAIIFKEPILFQELIIPKPVNYRFNTNDYTDH